MCVQALMINILNLIYEKWTSRINEQARDFVVGFVFVVLATFFPLWQSASFDYIMYTETQRHIVSSMLFLIAIVFSIKEPLQKIHWNKWIIVPMWGAGIGIIVTRMLHSIGSGYFVFGIMLLTVYPCLYLVWVNRGDFEHLFDIISWANILVGVCYIAYSAAIFRIYPWDVVVSGRVRATLYNSNLYSMIGTTVSCCALYLLFRKWHMRGQRWLCGLAFIVGLIATILGQSRASILVLAGAVVIVLIYTAKCGRLSRRAVRTTATLCCAVVLSIGLFAVYQESVVADTAEDEQTSVIERFFPDGEDINTYSSGRITIWTFYAEHLNLLGNDFDAIDRSSLAVTHAHNNFLEFGFRCGVIVAGVFLLAELIVGIISLQYLFSKRKTRDYMLFCVIMMFMYTIESLVDIATVPMERYAPFFFYLMLAGMAGRKANSHNSTGRYRGKH